LNYTRVGSGRRVPRPHYAGNFTAEEAHKCDGRSGRLRPWRETDCGGAYWILRRSERDREAIRSQILGWAASHLRRVRRAEHDRQSLALRVCAAAAQVGEPAADVAAIEVADDRAVPGRFLVADDFAARAAHRGEQRDLRHHLAGALVTQQFLVADQMALVISQALLAHAAYSAMVEQPPIANTPQVSMLCSSFFFSCNAYLLPMSANLLSLSDQRIGKMSSLHVLLQVHTATHKYPQVIGGIVLFHT